MPLTLLYSQYEEHWIQLGKYFWNIYAFLWKTKSEKANCLNAGESLLISLGKSFFFQGLSISWGTVVLHPQRISVRNTEIPFCLKLSVSHVQSLRVLNMKANASYKMLAIEAINSDDEVSIVCEPILRIHSTWTWSGLNPVYVTGIQVNQLPFYT